MYLFNRVELDEEIQKIADEFEKYNVFFKDVGDSPIGKYSINKILETVEESLNYLEIYSPIIKSWVNKYLEDHRGKLWLYYGISKGRYHADYWKIRDTDFSELSTTWPFLFNRDIPKYKDFIVDLRGAQSEIIRQRERQSTTNPNYKPFHPDGCSSGCSCWMLDDMEQWFEEERKEVEESTNIFFNGNIQNEFYQAALEDLQSLRSQWENWIPDVPISKVPNNNFSLSTGQTPIKIVLTWIKNDFYYSNIFSMFHWSDKFKDVWENIDSVETFIKCEREKLKKIIDLL